VSVILYDKDNQNNVLAKLPMTKGAKGEWSISLTSATGLSISDYRGYYYHYEMERDRETVLTLDPYAKSLAARSEERRVGKEVRVQDVSCVSTTQTQSKV